MRTRSILAAIAALALAATPVFAAGPFAQVDTGSTSIDFRPIVSDLTLTLTVSGPEGFYFERAFAAGEAASFSVFDSAGEFLPSGSYTWELRAAPELTDAQRDQMGDLRAGGADAASLRKAGKLPASFAAMSGAFTVDQGAIVPGDAVEQAPAGDNRLATKDQVIPDDLIVQQSLCVGQDCVNNESFGFDTIRMKENNTRIKFQDTSVGTFPTVDWELQANESANGGQNWFAINDIDNGRRILTLEAAAPTNSFYVDDAGNWGRKTSTPAVEIHVVDGDSPTLRLQQDGSSGFTPQTWDIAGNEANFFVRDVTNGSQLAFRIEPGADTSSIHVESNNYVGIGLAGAEANLHVKQTDANNGFILERAGNPVTMLFEDSTAGQLWEFKINASGAFAINDPSASGGEFNLDSDGNLGIKGMLAEGSSRTIKSAFADVDARDVLARVTEMPVTTWVYTGQSARHMGPMAEDFYATFGLGADAEHIAPGDKAGVALAAIQGLEQVVEEKVDGVASELREAQATIEQLHAEKTRLEERLARLEALLDVEN